MSQEPMLNIEERAPLWLGGIMAVLHGLVTYGPVELARFIRETAILVPLGAPDIPISHHVTSLLGAGFVHADWSHVLVNSGMIIAFAVITLRGVRALAEDAGKPPRAELIFVIIFLCGVASGSLFQWAWWSITDNISAASLGASGGGSALFATAAWAMGGRGRLLKFGMGWALINVIFVLAASIFGPIAWPGHIGGYVIGALLAPYLVKPFSTGFSITR